MNEPSLSEHEIRSLLTEDSPPPLSADQRSRLAQRLGLGEEVGSGPAVVEVAPEADISVAPRPSPGGRKRVWPAVAAAAAVVLVVGLVATMIGSRSTDTGAIEVADISERGVPTAVPTSEPLVPPAAVICRDRIGPFAAAIVTWDGIDNWAALTDSRLPEPDLVTLALSAIAAVQEADGVASTTALEEARTALSEVRAGLVTGPDTEGGFQWNRAQRDAHQAAVVLAETALAEVIEREQWTSFEGCRSG